MSTLLTGGSAPRPTEADRRPPADPAWRAGARCRGDVAVHFFPPSALERKEQKDAREEAARALCAACPVRQTCLDHALTTGEPHGIWGGLNELERRRLLRRRAAAQEPRDA